MHGAQDCYIIIIRLVAFLATGKPTGPVHASHEDSGMNTLRAGIPNTLAYVSQHSQREGGEPRLILPLSMVYGLAVG